MNSDAVHEAATKLVEHRDEASCSRSPCQAAFSFLSAVRDLVLRSMTQSTDHGFDIAYEVGG
jgi:hypothetical protein